MWPLYKVLILLVRVLGKLLAIYKGENIRKLLGNIMKYKKTLLGGLSLIGTITAFSAVAAENELPTIQVEADKTVDATTSTLNLDNSYSADGGELLLQTPGISGVKMGNHGVDPVIRGQKHNQLNILLDGAYIHGGCPNRMDPPSSFASAELYDKVTVLKGVQTLIYGSGGSGGTVLFERSIPTFENDEKVTSKVGAGYRSNGNAWDVFADVAGGSEKGYVRGSATVKKGETYTDGDGNDVRSGYSEQSLMASLGGKSEGGTKYRFDIDAVRGKDILYAGANMDSPQADNDTYKFSIESGKLASFETVKAEIYRSDVTHDMDNFSYRTNTGMWMRVPSKSITDGIRLKGNMTLGKGDLTLGVDYKKGDRDATRYGGAAGTVPTNSNAFMWPGVETDQTGLFAEYQGNISKGNRYTAGMRLDKVNTNATKAALAAGSGAIANTLYNMYYGVTASKKSENNVSALYRMEHDLSKDNMLFWGVSRTMRTADETERYLAAGSTTAAKRWVGNPDLKPEAHAQIDVGLNFNGKNSKSSISVYYDNVSDYILRDRAHGQTGILRTDNATIYRNVAAVLYGVDYEASYKWSDNWRSNFTGAYVHSQNTTDNRVIAQTPPLEGSVSLEYLNNDWVLGADVRLVAEQTRVEDDMTTDSGLDAGPSKGFGVLNLYGSMKLGKKGDLKFGIDNVLDTTYAEHLNKPSAFDTSVVRVNEAGRSIWTRVSMKF